MKDSHNRTPRTLADCDFTVGYPTAYPSRLRTVGEVLLGTGVIAALVLVFVYALVEWAAQ